MPRVFVSHKDSDGELAKCVAARIRKNGLGAYLDSIDSNVLNDGLRLAEYLLERMGECQQLIAVVSSSTAKSWWVPWEIGVGSEKGFMMASYSEQAVELPTYLSKWPDLRSMADVDRYCQRSRTTEERIRGATANFLSEAERTDVRRRQAALFHRQLRLDLMGERFSRS